MIELAFDLPCPTSESPVVQPSLWIGSFELTEPVMVLTDVIVGCICFFAFFKLNKYPRTRIRFYVRTYFFGMGMATIFGGILGHGMLRYVPFEFKLPGWILSMVAIAVFERACIEIAKPHIKRGIGTFFSWVNIIELLTFITLSFGSLCFFYVELHTAYGLGIVVFSFSLFTYMKTKNQGSRLIVIGVITAIPAAVAFTFQLYISPWFTHIDIGHVFMSIATVFFYIGSRKLLESLPDKK